MVNSSSKLCKLKTNRAFGIMPGIWGVEIQIQQLIIPTSHILKQTWNELLAGKVSTEQSGQPVRETLTSFSYLKLSRNSSKEDLKVIFCARDFPRQKEKDKLMVCWTAGSMPVW